jgi:hypothetical protein
MKHRKDQAEPGTERRRQPNGPGRRGFLQQAGLAAVVAGGLQTLRISQASAATTGKRSAVPPGKVVPPSKDVGAVYPRAGRPGPDSPPGVTWYRAAGNSGRPGQERSYFWYDSSNGEYGGPVLV